MMDFVRLKEFTFRLAKNVLVSRYEASHPVSRFVAINMR